MDGLRRFLTEPEHLGFRRLPPRAAFFHYADAAAARSGGVPRCLSLDGEWQFQLFATPEAVDLALPRGAAVTVPDSWTLRPGEADAPHYTNIAMPFPGLPPELPESIPTGVYARNFTLDADWAARRTILHFAGVEGAFAVWVNGRLAGAAKESREVAEFDISSWLQAGVNRLVVAVCKWSSATYLEDQDHWYLPGLSRSVRLESFPEHHVADFFCKTSLADDYATGLFELEIFAAFPALDAAAIARQRLTVNLFDPAGELIFAATPTTPQDYRLSNRDPRRKAYRVRGEVPAVRRWSAETPELYTMVITLADPDGLVSDAVSCRVGFRRYEWRDREFLINGRRVRIDGMNLHSHHGTLGKAVPLETIRQDVELMKRYNVNAVRTSHYPQPPEFYDLCDEYGLYVLDETDLECHAFMTDLVQNPLWAAPFLSRAVRMFERDKNHACIFGWSLGNESGHGGNHAAMAGYLRHRDDSRIIHSEGAIGGDFQDFTNWRTNHDLTDLVCPMYPSVEELIAWSETEHRGDPRPLILCEYCAAMGNAAGGLAAYYEVFRRCRGIQGGFIWEWLDHGLRQIGPDGKPYWAYGGDFGDLPNDGNCCINGMVDADRTVHPALDEFKALAQPAELTLIEASAGRVKVTNWRDFTTLDDLAMQWRLEADGRLLGEGQAALPSLAPGTSGEVRLPLPRLAALPGARLVLKVSLVYRAANRFAPEGWVAAAAGFDVAPQQWTAFPPHPVCGCRVTPQEVVAGELTLSLRGGEAVSLRDAAGEYWVLPLTVSLWRAATDGDGEKLQLGVAGNEWRTRSLSDWLALGLDRATLCHGLPALTGDAVAGTDELEFPGTAERVVRYWRWLPQPDGSLRLENRFVVPERFANLPRLGLLLALPASFDRVGYFGNGPMENYVDRRTAALPGYYEGTVDELGFRYTMPQTNGNRTGVEFAVLGDAAGRRLLIVAPGEGMDFSVSHASEAAIFRARHWFEVASEEVTWVHCDVRNRGVGNGCIGHNDTRPEYRIAPGEYRFTLLFKALDATADPAVAARRAQLG